MPMESVFKVTAAIVLWMSFSLVAQAQKDTTAPKETLEHRLKRQKGFIGKLAGTLVGDTVHSDLQIAPPLRNDLSFRRFENLAIRNIDIERLDFGTLITDTARNFKNKFTRLANTFHHKSREYVIRNNLFFKKGDRVISFLLADNERYLRDQPYIQDAKIILYQVEESPDSVDIIIRVKDVLSIGGSIEISNPKSAEFTVKEDNLDGWGNTLSIGSLYNQNRRIHSGISGLYVNRNIAGSFIDAYVNYSTFASEFNTGQHEEEQLSVQLIKPLVNEYTKWIYTFQGGDHVSQNMFYPDSVYHSDIKYHYFNYDGWVGWNTGAYKLARGNEDNRLRTLVSLRYFKQLFLQIPDKYINNYYYQYADITGVLGSVSLFKQNFYKTQYFYGFGRNEDVPEGVDLSLTAGWIQKQQKNRPYAGINLQRYFFPANHGYYHLTLMAGGFWGDHKPEDFNLLAGVDHYSRLHDLGSGWKERSLINASITGQLSRVLNPPLYLQSQYGLDEWKNSVSAAADFRATLRGEAVFFSPVTFVNFHFAPFVFGNVSMVTPVDQNLEKSELYSSIGGGIRTRNESLTFGTFELKFFYFPRKTFTGDTWRIETNTGIRFKYNSQFLRKPDLINVN